MRRRLFHRPGLARCPLVVIALFTVLACGCKGKNDSPARYDLSGRVTFGGEPIPVGVISFSPDTQQGNQGPGSTGRIQDGRYQTRPGKGIVGGAYLVTIDGFKADAKATPLFAPCQISVALPEKGGTYDFDVPATASKPHGDIVIDGRSPKTGPE